MANEEDDLPDLDSVGQDTPVEETQPQPLYRIFEHSRIAVGRGTGRRFKRMLDAALKAYEDTHSIWEECFRYYNNNQSKMQLTGSGRFSRGDSTENVVFSNLNIMLPAVYSKDPNFSCTTLDEQDQPFCDAMQAVLNMQIRQRDGMSAKQKVKRAAGIALLTNFGVMKLGFTKKDDSREMAANEMQRITDELGKASTEKDAEKLYGELEALEQRMEVLEKSGFSLDALYPHNLIVDPHAEQADGMDAKWMMERVFMSTSYLTASFTKPADDYEGDECGRVLVYKPTHKAIFAEGVQGERDDGVGFVLAEIDRSAMSQSSQVTDERESYAEMYYSECYYVWDKATRRVFLFHRDDWSWPIWVWDDPLKITRFFPYFIISLSLSTGGTVSVGETAYILDQQDEINAINQQKAKIRRAVFNHWFYNSDKIKPTEASKFINVLRGVNDGSDSDFLLGVEAGESKITDCIEAVAPPSVNYEPLFDKMGILETINRITNTSDALRGVQFRTNTNVSAVKSYEQSMRISVGAKVDVIEDVVADIGNAMAEIAIMNFDQDAVEGMIGTVLAKGWEQMDVETMRANYDITVVSGSMEKPNSAFKKQEAIEVVQAVGQFASAAPAATLKIMLRVLEQAFTEVVIKKSDWDEIDSEAAANLTRGQSTGQGNDATGGTGSEMDQLAAQAQKLPDADKQEIAAMAKRGDDPRKIVEFVKQKLGATTNGNATPEPIH